MKQELEYLIVNYSEKDLDYINELLEYLNANCEEIVKWFEIEDFGVKPVVTIFCGVKEFYQAILDYKPEEKIYNWVAGYAFKKDGVNIIYTLSIEGLLQTAHKNANILELEKLIIHEFSHSCQQKINNASNAIWLLEGMAVFLAGQHSKDVGPITTSLDNMLENHNGQGKYGDYKKMFCYVYETYGKEYCLELLRNKELTYNMTPKLYEEALNYYKETLKR